MKMEPEGQTGMNQPHSGTAHVLQAGWNLRRPLQLCTTVWDGSLAIRLPTSTGYVTEQVGGVSTF
jgi:hypothetical protein